MLPYLSMDTKLAHVLRHVEISMNFTESARFNELFCARNEQRVRYIEKQL